MIIVGVLVLLVSLFHVGKEAFLIAGYNTMSPAVVLVGAFFADRAAKK